MPKEADDDTMELADVVRDAMQESENEDSGGDGKERDEGGRFVAKEDEKPVDTAKRLEPKEPEQKEGEKTKESGTLPEEGGDPKEGDRLLNKDMAPRGWTPAAREKWSSLPDDIRAEILRREEASAVGVRQLQERYAPVDNFVRNLMPFIQEAQQNGQIPDQYIGGVLSSERILRTASVPDKFQEILRIADQYGVPLRDVINESVGQKVIPPANQGPQYQLPPDIQRELQEMRAWRQQQEQQGSNEVNQHIATFAEGKEFFDDVRLIMASMIQEGLATTLEQAYDDACWAVPGVRSVLQQREQLKKNQDAASGASLKPKGELEEVGDDKDDDIGDTVRKAYAASVSGRV